MTYREIVHWLELLPNYAYLGLPREQKLIRIKTALTFFKDPHSLSNILHVAGSKGKSSTSISCSYCLQLAGFNVGVFTSPHVQSYRERIVYNDQWISEADFVTLAEKVKQYCDTQGIILIPFEILFIIACLFFRKKKCDWVIYEVGLGGRFDTTNVVAPTYTIVTEIEKEHTDILGDTIQKITKEKAGIIKEGIPLMIGAQVHSEAKDLLVRYAQDAHAPQHYMPSICRYTITQHDIDHITADIQLCPDTMTSKTIPESMKNSEIASSKKQLKPSKTAPSGEIPSLKIPPLKLVVKSHTINPTIFEDQLLGFVTCYFATHTFRDYCNTLTSFEFSDRAQLPARSEILYTSKISSHTNSRLFLDAAHTRNSCRTAFTTIARHFPNSLLLFSLAYNKEHALILGELIAQHTLFSEIIVTSTGSEKKSKPEDIFASLNTIHAKTRLIPNINKAFDYALHASSLQKKDICCIGSFFLASEVRNLWKNQENKPKK